MVKRRRTNGVVTVKELDAKLSRAMRDRKPELKAHTATGTMEVNFTGALKQLTDIDQGVSVEERVGLTVRAKRWTFSWQRIDFGQSVVALRVIIVVDRDGDGTSPTAAEILSVAGSAFAVVSPMNAATRSRFRVLRDVIYQQNATQGDPCGTRNGTNFGALSGKLDHLVHYASATGSSGFRRGSVFALLIASNTTAETFNSGEGLDFTDC